jgi:hypothetical protein
VVVSSFKARPAGGRKLIKILLLRLLDELPDGLHLLLVDGVAGDIAEVGELHVKGAKL